MPIKSDPRLPQPGEIACVCTNLKMAARAMGRLYDRAFAPFGLNAMQFAILNNIGKYGSISTLDLAGLLSLERTTLYRALAVLVRRGFVLTKPGRGREQILSLSAKGRAMRAKASVAWEAVQEKFASLFGSDLEALLEQLRHARVIAEAAAGQEG